MKDSKTANLRNNQIYFILSVVLFCLSLANFFYLWRNSNVFDQIACVGCPWFYEWSYWNEPTILLISSYFLLYNLRARYFTPIILSSFVVIKGLYLITKYGWKEWLDNLTQSLKLSPDLRMNIFEMWEIQLVLAIIILSFSLIALVKNKIPEDII